MNDSKSEVNNSESNTSTTRRILLTMGTAGLASLAGCTDLLPGKREEGPNESADSTDGPEAGEDQINVTEAGADPSGETPIDSVLSDIVSDDASIYFPPGEYKLGQLSGRFQNLTLSGNNATILPEDRSSLWKLLDLQGPGNIIDGFVFDYREAELPPEIRITGPDGWAFKNCTFRGIQQTNLPHRGGFALLPAVTIEDGSGLVQNVYLHEGSAPPDGGDTRGGIWFGPSNKGTLRIDGVWMESWAENTIYGHNSPGKVIIENSFFRNSNVAGTRIGGNTILRNNTYVKTGPVPRQTHPERSGQLMRGVWITGGGRPYGSNGSVLITDCDFVFLDENHGDASIQLRDPIEGPLTIKNCRIRQDFDQAIAIDASSPVSIENVQISGKTTAPAIKINSEATIRNISGTVATAGSVSNRSDVINKLSGRFVKNPNPNPPTNLSKPAGADALPKQIK